MPNTHHIVCQNIDMKIYICTTVILKINSFQYNTLITLPIVKIYNNSRTYSFQSIILDTVQADLQLILHFYIQRKKILKFSC